MARKGSQYVPVKEREGRRKMGEKEGRRKGGKKGGSK